MNLQGIEFLNNSRGSKVKRKQVKRKGVNYIFELENTAAERQEPILPRGQALFEANNQWGPCFESTRVCADRNTKVVERNSPSLAIEDAGGS